MHTAKVPQNLELDDVVAWGLGATDLLCLIAGAVVSWWLYLAAPGELATRVVLAAPGVVVGLAVGVVQVDGRSLREWLIVASAFLARPRVLLVGGRP
jgi:PrgI family protein